MWYRMIDCFTSPECIIMCAPLSSMVWTVETDTRGRPDQDCEPQAWKLQQKFSDSSKNWVEGMTQINFATTWYRAWYFFLLCVGSVFTQKSKLGWLISTGKHAFNLVYIYVLLKAIYEYLNAFIIVLLPHFIDLILILTIITGNEHCNMVSNAILSCWNLSILSLYTCPWVLGLGCEENLYFEHLNSRPHPPIQPIRSK